MNRLFWIAAAALLAVVLVCLVTRSGAVLPMQSDDSVIAVYDVPVDRAFEINSAISGILRQAKTPVGSSRLAGPSQIIVLAPASVQSGLQRALVQLGAGKAPTLRAKQALTLHTWLLRSSASETLDPALSALTEQTSALKQELGAVGFELVDSMRVSLASNADTAMIETPRGSSIRARALTDGDGYVLEFALSRNGSNGSNGSSLNTRTSMAPGQTIILSTVNGPEKGQSEVIILRLDQPSA